MRIVRYPDGHSFLQSARPWLLRAEAENNLILGNAPAIAAPLQGGSGAYLACVYADCDIVGCAMRTPPPARRHKLVVTRLPPETVVPLVDDVMTLDAALPGVFGPEPSVTAFADAWSKRIGQRAAMGGRQRIYQIERLLPTSDRSPGTLRKARPADLDLVTGWVAAFSAEASPSESVDPAEVAASRIAHEMLFLWEDPEPVAMAAWAGKTPNGVRVNLVYTLPACRRRGYASACVSEVTRRLLESGNRFCFLFTALSNPTSNSIYQRLGYRPVCDTADYDFLN